MSTTPLMTALAVCFLCASSAHSADARDYARSGGYIGIAAEGGAFTKAEDEIGGGSSVDANVDVSAGFTLLGGYRATPHFSVEAELELLPKVGFDADGFGKFAELLALAFTTNAKVSLTQGAIQPFALIGIGVLYVELEDTFGLGVRGTDSGFAARFGGGVEAYLTERVVLFARTTYVLPAGDVKKLDYVSFGGGLMLRF